MTNCGLVSENSWGRGRPSGWFSAESGKGYAALVRPIRKGTLVEVGVYMGRSLSHILPICSRNGSTVYAVDNWSGTRLQRGDPMIGRAVKASFFEWLREQPGRESVKVLCMASVDAAKQFADGGVDLVMIDADHDYKAVLADLRAWVPKLNRRGVLCGHDLNMPGVKLALRHSGLKVDGRAGKSFWWCTPNGV